MIPNRLRDLAADSWKTGCGCWRWVSARIPWPAMIRQPIERRTQLILGVISICLIVVLYGCLSYRQHRRNPRDTTIPNLGQFVEGWKRVLTPDPPREAWSVQDLWPPTSRIWLVEDLGATYTRLFLGMLVGSLLALVLGTCWRSTSCWSAPS